MSDDKKVVKDHEHRKDNNESKANKNSKDQKIKQICEEVFKKQPEKVSRLDSLGNYVFLLEYPSSEKYVLKIINVEADNIFLFDEKNHENIYKNSNFYKSTSVKETETWSVERFIEGRTLNVKDHRSQETRCLYMKRVNEFHQQSSKTGLENHFLFKLWDYKDRIYKKILLNAENNPRLNDIKNILEHFDDYVTNVFKKTKIDQKLLFVHNDLLTGNWLYDKENNKYKIIDFEYCGFGYFMTDIYNIIIEAIYDYNAEKSPGYIKDKNALATPDQFREMIRFYLFFEEYGEEFYDTEDEIKQVEEIRSDPRFKSIKQQMVDEYYNNSSFYGSICNLYWCLWAFYIYQKENSETDYVRYGFDRYEDFSSLIGEARINLDK